MVWLQDWLKIRKDKEREKRVGTERIEELRAVYGRNVAEIRHHHAGGFEWNERKEKEYRDSALRRDR